MKKEFEELRKSKYFKYIVAFGIIKKVILLVMFLVPLLSFSQLTLNKILNIETEQDFKRTFIEEGFQEETGKKDLKFNN